MVTILPPKTNAGDFIGEGFGQGISSGMQRGADQAFTQSTLQRAFDKIDPNFDKLPYIQQLGKLAPILMTQPGGAQLLGDIMPILAERGKNDAIRNVIQNRRGTTQSGTDQAGNSQPSTSSPQQQPQTQINIPAPNNAVSAAQRGEDLYRNPSAPQSEFNTFPERSVGPQIQRVPSQAEVQDKALQFIDESMNYGKPMSYEQAYALAQQEQAAIINQNEMVESQKQSQEAAQEKLNAGLVARAQNAGLVEDPEDVAMVEKFAKKAKRGETPDEQWRYVKAEMDRYKNAKDTIKTQSGIRLWDKIYNAATGNPQPLDRIKDNLQHPLDFYRENGMFEEARKLLVNDVGMGPEDAEDTLFPMKPDQKKAVNSFPENKDYKLQKPIFDKSVDVFPGEESRLSPDKFPAFKESLRKILNDHKGLNIISLRGVLNREKHYAWQDISDAMQQLEQERLFTPDYVQESNMSIIKQAPLPGMSQIFKNYMQGTK